MSHLHGDLIWRNFTTLAKCLWPFLKDSFNSWQIFIYLIINLATWSHCLPLVGRSHDLIFSWLWCHQSIDQFKTHFHDDDDDADNVLFDLFCCCCSIFDKKVGKVNFHWTKSSWLQKSLQIKFSIFNFVDKQPTSAASQVEAFEVALAYGSNPNYHFLYHSHGKGHWSL